MKEKVYVIRLSTIYKNDFGIQTMSEMLKMTMAAMGSLHKGWLVHLTEVTDKQLLQEVHRVGMDEVLKVTKI